MLVVVPSTADRTWRATAAMIRRSSSAATSSDRFSLIADLEPWAVMWMRYRQPLDAEKGGRHVAGLGCIDIGGAPARRRDSGERQRRTDARPSRLVGDPRVAITSGHRLRYHRHPLIHGDEEPCADSQHEQCVSRLGHYHPRSVRQHPARRPLPSIWATSWLGYGPTAWLGCSWIRLTTAKDNPVSSAGTSSAAPALTPRALTVSLGRVPDEDARYGSDP